MNRITGLLGLNLVLALALAALVVPAKKSESFSNSRDNSRREAQSASYRGPQHKEHSIYGRSDATTQGPMTTNAELRLPQDVVLSRISGEALVVGDPPTISDEVCELIEAGTDERTALNAAVAEAVAQLKAVETANLEMRHDADGNAWYHVRSCAADAERISSQLCQSIKDTVGEDRARVVFELLRASAYFPSSRSIDLFFEVVEETNGESVVTFRAEWLPEDEASRFAYVNYPLGTQDNINSIEHRWGHLIDVRDLSAALASGGSK